MGLTKSNRLEEQVAEHQHEQLRTITENIPGVVFQFYSHSNGESGVRYTSPKLYDIFGLEFIDDPPVLLQTFIENIHQEDRQSFIDSIQEVAEKRIPWRWSGRYVKPSGRTIWFAGHSTPIILKDEIIFNGLLLDITEQKKDEDVLQKEHNAVSDLFNENNQGFRKEEILATFNVMNEANELEQVVVCQEIVTRYNKEENYPKRFRLESLYGVEVYQTENPNILKLADGTILKRIR